MTEARIKTVAVLFGGKSPEHDVSIVTGLQVCDALDRSLYDVFPIYVSREGDWYTGEELLDRSFYIPSEKRLRKLETVEFDMGIGGRSKVRVVRSQFFQRTKEITFDVAVPAFHGLFGEDGRVQGFLEMAGIPYTGMRTMASSVFMDKAATKRFLSCSGVPMLPFWEIRRPAARRLLLPHEVAAAVGELPFPCCVKPLHLGSSIGVARVTTMMELCDVLPSIFVYDDGAIVEPFVENLVEYNVAVRAVEGVIRTSAIERPKHTSELLDFREKYLSSSGAKKSGGKSLGQSSQGMLSLTREINPVLPNGIEVQIRTWAADAFRLAVGAGAPRLDFIANSKTGEIWLNEINPCPGSFGYFLWEAADRPTLFPDLLSDLISEAARLHEASQVPRDPVPEGARLFLRR